MYKGGIYAAGRPWDVITEDNIRTVYGVNCQVIDHHGRPHVILDDTMEELPDTDWEQPYREDDHPSLTAREE